MATGLVTTNCTCGMDETELLWYVLFRYVIAISPVDRGEAPNEEGI